MADTDIPDVDETDLTREEMEELAGEYDIDPDGLGDQELLERLGVALGEIDEAQIRERDERREADRRSAAASLRGRFAARLEGAADRLRPADEERDRPTDEEEADRSAGEAQQEAAEGETERSVDAEDRGGAGETRAAEEDAGDEAPSEQRLPGEPIKGRTRNQLRDELRELGLPVTGTKAQLEQRLAEAGSRRDTDAGGAGDDGDDRASDGDRDADARAGDHDHGSRMDRLRGKVSRRLHHGSDRAVDEGEEAADGGGAGEGANDGDAAADERLRDRLAEGLVVVADRLRASGRDVDASGAPSRLKRAGAAVKRRLPLG